MRHTIFFFFLVGATRSDAFVAPCGGVGAARSSVQPGSPLLLQPRLVDPVTVLTASASSSEEPSTSKVGAWLSTVVNETWEEEDAATLAAIIGAEVGEKVGSLLLYDERDELKAALESARSAAGAKIKGGDVQRILKALETAYTPAWASATTGAAPSGGSQDAKATRFIKWALQESFTVKKFDHTKEEFGPASERKGAFDLTLFSRTQGTWISLAVDEQPVRLLHQKQKFSDQFIDVLPAYPIVAKAILGLMQVATLCLVLRGTPGIGKTYFGSLFAAHLLRMGYHVFYERDNYAVHLDPNGVATRYVASSVAWEEGLRVRGLGKQAGMSLYIVDFGVKEPPTPPRDTEMHTCVITSSDIKNYKGWKKQLMASLRFFPRPSRNDVKEVFVACNPTSAISEMDERIAVVGLKIREVVDIEETLTMLQDNVKENYGELRDEERKGLLTGSSDGRARSCIIHEDALVRENGTYDLGERTKLPASEYVLKLAIQGHKELKVVKDVWAHLRRPTNKLEQSSRGLFFEQYIDLKLRQMLGDALQNNSPLFFPAVDFKTGVWSVEELRIQTVATGPKRGINAGTLTLFSSTTVRSFDGVYDPTDAQPAARVGLQATVQDAEAHKLYAADCSDLVPGAVAHIWFIVPLREFIEFKKRLQSAKRSRSQKKPTDDDDAADAPLLSPNFVGAGTQNLAWEAKVVCIDDFHEIADALTDVDGVDFELSRKVLQHLLEEKQFLKPLNRINLGTWREVDGVGPVKSRSLHSFCQPRSRRDSKELSNDPRLSDDLRMWWSHAED